MIRAEDLRAIQRIYDGIYTTTESYIIEVISDMIRTAIYRNSRSVKLNLGFVEDEVSAESIKEMFDYYRTFGYNVNYEDEDNIIISW